MRSLKIFFKLSVYLLAFCVVAALVYVLLPLPMKHPYLQFLAVFAVISCLIVIVVDLIFLLPTVRGAIYYPSSEQEILAILKLARIRHGEKAVDIGSGDGRIVARLAAAGATSYGYEINPLLVLLSIWKTRSLPAHHNIHFRWANLWWTDFGQFDVIVLFGMNYIMADLEKKLIKEMKPGSRIICNSFPFPHWKPTKRIDDIYLYVKKSQ